MNTTYLITLGECGSIGHWIFHTLEGANTFIELKNAERLAGALSMLKDDPETILCDHPGDYSYYAFDGDYVGWTQEDLISSLGEARDARQDLDELILSQEELVSENM